MTRFLKASPKGAFLATVVTLLFLSLGGLRLSGSISCSLLYCSAFQQYMIFSYDCSSGGGGQYACCDEEGEITDSMGYCDGNCVYCSWWDVVDGMQVNDHECCH
ncbi:MAG TPA: hypothetical protein VG675_24480 [Bryobacteraceae bacterium]|nr:hypothetical protein [Bryobacteraceae bacterium]